MRPRFRIRTLLILSALVAVACYWWIARPTIVAQRFIAAVDRRDYFAVSAMCADPFKYEPSQGFMYMNADLKAQLLPQTISDALLRRRRLALSQWTGRNRDVRFWQGIAEASTWNVRMPYMQMTAEEAEVYLYIQRLERAAAEDEK